jgi:predicted AlkP superfamily pyrophosphatase or phosphodiesterase
LLISNHNRRYQLVKYAIIVLLFCSPSLFAQSGHNAHVILISFDGFRHDYVEKYDLPNFKSFISRGSSSAALIPSFPSKTFPNHYTLVTGLYPGNHGLIDNSFYDKELDARYTMRNRELVENPVFYGGTPLWQLAQQQGIPSASFFWVGSELPVQGEYPTYYKRYDESTPNINRIEQVLVWLNLPVEERPRFITLYFSMVDTEGHRTGPNSDELKKTAIEADRLLGYLVSELKKVNLPVNVILVSDHGMTELKQEEKTFITLSKLFNTRDTSIIMVNSGTHAHVYTSKKDSLYLVLKKQENKYTVYKQEDFPKRWHYQHNRAGDLLIVAHNGYQLQLETRNFGVTDTAPSIGVHGYDPYNFPDMYGIFYAMGPNIKSGKRIPAFENIHVYPFIATILGLKPPKIDGRAEVLKGLYKK